MWLELTGAQIVDIRRVGSAAQAGAYVSKYITKDPAAPYGYRRYRTSQAYSSPPAKGQLTALLGITAWLHCPVPVEAALANLKTYNLTFTEIMPECWTTYIPPKPPPSASSNHADNAQPSDHEYGLISTPLAAN